RFSRAAYLYGLRLLQRLDDRQLPWGREGILELAADEDEAALQRACCRDMPDDYVSWLDQAAASRQAGLPVAAGGWWFPQGAWVDPAALCRALLAAAGPALSTYYNCEASALRKQDGRWH